MTTRTLAIPVISRKYSAEDLANILWDSNIAQVSSIYLCPLPYCTMSNSAFIIISDYEKNLHPIVNSLLEEKEFMTIQLGDENVALSIHIDKKNPLRETNEPPMPFKTESELLAEQEEVNKCLTSFHESYFENRPKASFVVSGLNY